MKIALGQIDIKWESKNDNYHKADMFISRAYRENCDVVVFPEMFNTGFSMNVSATAEDENGNTSKILAELARKYNMNIIAGFATKSSLEKKARNTASVYDRKGNLIARYTKLHPFSFVNEDQHYAAGSDTIVFDLEGISSTIFICYDLRFPESFRSVAKQVQAIFVIANWPSSRKEHWETLLKARAIENQCFVIGVNRTGTDGNGVHYPGMSRVFGPSGAVICADNDADEFISCSIDPDEVAEARTRFQFLKDMRL